MLKLLCALFLFTTYMQACQSTCCSNGAHQTVENTDPNSSSMVVQSVLLGKKKTTSNNSIHQPSSTMVDYLLDALMNRLQDQQYECCCDVRKPSRRSNLADPRLEYLADFLRKLDCPKRYCNGRTQCCKRKCCNYGNEMMNDPYGLSRYNKRTRPPQTSCCKAQMIPKDCCCTSSNSEEERSFNEYDDY